MRALPCVPAGTALLAGYMNVTAVILYFFPGILFNRKGFQLSDSLISFPKRSNSFAASKNPFPGATCSKQGLHQLRNVLHCVQHAYAS